MKNAELSYQKERDADEQRSAPSRVYRINCISVRRHIVLNVLIFQYQWDSGVGSMVCSRRASRDKQRYRRYRIQTLAGPTTTA